MKKSTQAVAFLLAISMLLCLSACGSSKKQNTDTLPLPENTGKEPDSTPEQQPPAPVVPDTPPAPGENQTEETPPSGNQDVRPLLLQKQQYGLYDWADTELLVKSTFSHVTLWRADAEEDTNLATVLEQKANMIKRSMETEYENMCASRREELPWTGENAETWVSSLDIQVRRADSLVVSLLSDSYSDYGWIEDFRGMHGTTYDARTGRELALTDVVEINNTLAEAVLKELNSHMWAGDFYANDTVEQYFANTPHDSISWTLDYNGVTFYFADGELAEAGNGRQTATVSFAEYPQLFQKTYMAVPEAYIVELPMDHSFFTDLDDDGDLEELNVTGFFDTDVGMYSSYGIYTDTDGHYDYQECFADGFRPYYVKTADGNHFIYLFCQENEGIMQWVTLKVIQVNGGLLTNVGEMHVGPDDIPGGTYLIPTDPANLYLYDYEAQNRMIFAVGTDGLPKQMEEIAPFFEVEGFIEYACYDEMLEDTTWWSYMDVDPQSGQSQWLASDEVVLVFRKDKTGTFQQGAEQNGFVWSCLEDGTACITLDNGCNYYLTLYEDGVEDSGMYWMMLMLEERLIWMY